MTGKDFSGPVPEIRNPVPPDPDSVDPVSVGPSNDSEIVRKRSRSRSRKSSINDGVEIVGDAATYES